MHGTYHDLTGAFCNPKPLHRPHPAIIIGGRSTPDPAGGPEHADV